MYAASPKEFVSIEGISKNLAVEIVHFLRGDDLEKAKKYAEQQLSRLNKIDGQIITYWDKTYPELLKKIYDPPAFFYMRGTFQPNDRFSIAMVGTRMPSSYGTSMAEKLSHELARMGVTITSGLARGIDTTSHDSALKAGGRTIAVLGSGLDVIYPQENKSLAERIVEDGVILSECEMGGKPDAINFPRRNRIVSGMSLGTVIIETALNGGAMITATTALDQNREVFAVPGPAGGKKSQGCNLLIKSGRAKLIETVEDITTELESKLRPLLRHSGEVVAKAPPSLSLFERSIFDILGEQPKQIDAISEEAKLSTPDTLVSLLNLEFKGLVKQLPGKMFLRLE
jgi:DNA processing protein